jgi:hypothetical protein
MCIRNEEKVVRYVQHLQTAVLRDGFEGFFLAEAGDHAQATLNALLIIGAVDVAALLRRAMWVFGGGAPPLERAARRAELSRVGEAGRSLLQRLDESFRRDSDELTRALTEYAQTLDEPCVVT